MKFLKEVFSKENIINSLALNSMATSRLSSQTIQMYVDLSREIKQEQTKKEQAA